MNKKIFKGLVLGLLSATLTLASCNNSPEESSSSSSGSTQTSSVTTSTSRSGTSVYNDGSSVEEGNESSIPDSEGSSIEEVIAKPKSLLPTDEMNDIVTAEITKDKLEEDDSDVFFMLSQALASDLIEIGYHVFPGYAVIDVEENILVPGIAYTNYDPYVIEDGNEESTGFYSCGFYQFVLSNEEVCLTDEVVKKGVPVIYEDDTAKEGHYIISIQVDVQPFSGIYLDKYFSYKKINDYAVCVTIKENNRLYWDEKIDLYDFDAMKYVFRSDINFESPNPVSFYEDEDRAYTVARKAYEQIVEVQNDNAFKSETSVVFVFTQDLIDHYVVSNQMETLNDYLVSELRKVELEPHQFLMFTEDGVSIQSTQEYIDEKAEERMVNGIIAAIASAVAIGGSIYVAIATGGAGIPLALKTITICSQVLMVTFSASEAIASGFDIYYGANKDLESEAFNPLYAAFKGTFKDEDTARSAYHVFGTTVSILATCTGLAAGLTAAGSAAAKGAELAGKSVSIAVTRAVLVTFTKIVITVGVSIAVGQGVTYLVSSATGKECYGRLAGTISAIIAGFVIGGALNKIDKKYSLSFDKESYAKYQNYKMNEKKVKTLEKILRKDPNGLTRNQKGDYGELKALTDNPDYELVSNRTKRQGIDLILKNKDGEYVLVECKYNESDLKVNKLTGKQMSEEWIDHNLLDAFGGRTPEYKEFMTAKANGKVYSAVYHIGGPETDFLATIKGVDSAGNYTGLEANSLSAFLEALKSIAGAAAVV